MSNYKLKLYVCILTVSSIYVSSTIAYTCESLSYRTGVTVHCEHPVTKELVDCRSGSVPVGTVVQYYCDDFYVTQDGDRTGGSMKCDDQGNWTPEQHFRAFSCSIDCGRVSGPVTSTYCPWHAVIFERNQSSETFNYACGGTLINPFNAGFVIITSARCLQNRQGYGIDPRNLKVSMGLSTNDFQANSASEESITFSVEKVAIETQGRLALLKLEEDVQLGRNIVPTCFNGNPDLAIHQLREGSSKLVGFGELQNQRQSHRSTLRSVSVKVSQKLQCRSKLSGNEFCAGSSREDRNICSGDSGGGLNFPLGTGSSQRSYLQGVLTDVYEENRNCKDYASFTRVNDFASWIKKTTIQLNEEYSDQSENKPVRPPSSEVTPVMHIDLPFRHNTPIVSRPTQTEGQKYRPVGSIKERPVPASFPSNSNPKPSTRPATSSAIQISESSESVVYNPKDYELVGVEWHNYYRAKHGSPPLALNPDLSREAQVEADRSLHENKYRFEGFTNFFGLNGGNLNSTKIVQEAITDWYKTSANYDYNKPRSLPFANIVWRSTTDIGIGVARKGVKQIVVVKYNRPLTTAGEQEKSFRENVHRPLPYN